MIFPKRLFPLLAVIMGILLSGCGSTTTTTTTGSSSSSQYTSATATPTSAPATATPAPTDSNIVKTTSATVNGKTTTILANAQGMTLYYFTPDTGTKVACTDSCAQSWPPLLFTGSGKPSAAVKLPGELEVYANPNGKQIIYNDHPLYTFSGDTAAGQTNGNGIGGKWFVATVDLPKNKA